jgi:hypothetical protein
MEDNKSARSTCPPWRGGPGRLRAAAAGLEAQPLSHMRWSDPTAVGCSAMRPSEPEIDGATVRLARTLAGS